jgi:hypothetical protein
MSHQFDAKASALRQRKAYMFSARATRQLLTDPAGNWRYSPNDERVKEAVGVWVARARAAHAAAMGRNIRPCLLTPITDREFPGLCTAGKSLEFASEAVARAYARAEGIGEFMISSNAAPLSEGQRFNIANL